MPLGVAFFSILDADMYLLAFAKKKSFMELTMEEIDEYEESYNFFTFWKMLFWRFAKMTTDLSCTRKYWYADWDEPEK